LFGRSSSRSEQSAPARSPVPAPVFAAEPQRARSTLQGTREGGYAVLDVETTGLSPRDHRVVSMAVVLLDAQGRVQHEWETLVNPQGPVGATHIHGIRDVDVAHAPTFDTLVIPLVELLRGRAVAGHNVKFDVAFLKHELGRAGWGWPSAPTLCTLQESFHFLPQLDRRRLVDCCWASGFDLEGAHSALGDARGTARLLAAYLDPYTGVPPLPSHRSILSVATATKWPSEPGSGVISDPARPRRELSQRARRVIAKPPAKKTSLLESFTLADALDDGAPQGTLSYLETLVEVLEDGQLTEEEQATLSDVVELYELSEDDTVAAHRGLVRALAHEALEDGVLARAEKAELTHIAALLAVPATQVKDLLDGAEEVRLRALSAGLPALPGDWSLGEPLRVGQRVAFTGCDAVERDALESRATAAGVRVTGSVSRRTTLLVTDGTCAGTKVAAAEQFGIRQVHPREFAALLDHLQPWVPTQPARSVVARPSPAAPDNATPGDRKTHLSATAVSDTGRASPSVVRAWARENGYDVGVRGRLSADLWDAYSAAQR